MNTQWISGLALLVLSAAGFGLAAGDARAQSYPNKPVTLIVPYGPGTGIDVVGRVVAQKVSETWTYPIVVVNRPGATGGIGVEIAAKAAPDGYTIVIAATSQIVNQQATKVRYDLEKDFAPVSLTASQPLMCCIAPAASCVQCTSS